MWLARDETGFLFAYSKRPIKSYHFWYEEYVVYQLKSELFPNVTWEGEPKWIRVIQEDWLYVDSKG